MLQFDWNWSQIAPCKINFPYFKCWHLLDLRSRSSAHTYAVEWLYSEANLWPTETAARWPKKVSIWPVVILSYEDYHKYNHLTGRSLCSQPIDGLNIELLQSMETMRWFVVGASIVYSHSGDHRWPKSKMDLLLLCTGNILCDHSRSYAVQVVPCFLRKVTATQPVGFAEGSGVNSFRLVVVVFHWSDQQYAIQDSRRGFSSFLKWQLSSLWERDRKVERYVITFESHGKVCQTQFILGWKIVLQIWTRLTITRRHMTAKPKLSFFILSMINLTLCLLLQWYNSVYCCFRRIKPWIMLNFNH